jgi:GntR family transcriptional regulator, transcriptional repressor for pyruvate dehydrogenase complex
MLYVVRQLKIMYALGMDVNKADSLGVRSVVVEGLAGRQRGGLVAEVVRSLGDDIQSHRLASGEKLPSEAEIMERFQVSRTVVREAISRLQAQGLVRTRHGVGTFVDEPSAASNFRISPQALATVADVIQVLELRISLETEAAGLAAQRRTPENLDALAKALQDFERAIGQDLDAAPSDFQFHLEIARATGNRHFAELMTYLGTMIIPRTRVNTPERSPEGRSAYLHRVQTEHESIFLAIQVQDAQAARAAMRMHLSNSRERLASSHQNR